MVYCLLLFLSSHRPVPALGGLPAGSDKVLHFLAYAILGALWMRALRPGPGRAGVGLLLATALAAGFGAVDEWHQSFVPGRSADVLDLLADLLGAVAGAAAYAYLIGRRVARLDHPC